MVDFKIALIIFLILFIYSEGSNAQIAYPDSCLHLKLFYISKNSKLDTIKTVKLKKGIEMLQKSWSNSKVFNLVAQFQNVCTETIEIPDEVKLVANFWIECIRVDNNRNDTIDFSISVDYLPGKEGVGCIKLKPNKLKILDYDFPLALKIKEEGTYKFRLQFQNMCNYVPFEQWRIYFSNWIYLKLN
ncbi:MAG: hypothetical protein V4556_07470 [Bacteroidota bacterium]